MHTLRERTERSGSPYAVFRPMTSGKQKAQFRSGIGRQAPVRYAASGNFSPFQNAAVIQPARRAVSPLVNGRLGRFRPNPQPKTGIALQPLVFSPL